MVLIFTNTQLSEMSNTSLRDKLLEISGITLEQLNTEAQGSGKESAILFPHRVFVPIEGDTTYLYDIEWLAKTDDNVCPGCALSVCVKHFITSRLGVEVTDELVTELKSYAAFIQGLYDEHIFHSKIPGETVHGTCTSCGETSNWNGQVSWNTYVERTGWESEKKLV